MIEFKDNDRVQHVGKHYYGHIKALDLTTKEALVKEEKTGKNNLVGLAWLVLAPVPKEEPFKPGWYRIKFRPASNFIYYVAAEVAGKFYYTHAFNPATGEMDATMGSQYVIVSQAALNVSRGDLIRLKFVDA